MGQPVYGMSQPYKDRVDDLLRTRNLSPPTGPVDRQGLGSYACIVTPTAIAGDDDGYRHYTATAKIFNAVSGAYDSMDGTVYLLSKVDLVLGEPYPAMQTGTRTISAVKREAFVAEVRKFKWVRVLTDEDPYCEGGNLHIPYEWAAVLDTGPDADDFMLPPPPPP